MAVTKLQNLVDPQVMADMVSANIPKAIKFAPFARIDNTLTGRPGSTITVPKYAYIGDAEDVAEAVAMGTTVLSASTTEAKVKKAGKAIEISDEAALSGLGDPIGQGVRQLTMSIASKLDNDCYDMLGTAPLNVAAAALSYDNIVKADALFEDETDNALAKVIFIHPNQEAELRQDADFKDKNKFGGDVMMSGVIGTIAGIQVKKSKKVKEIKYEYNAAGTITIVADSVSEDSTNKHLSTIVANAIAYKKESDGTTTALKVGDKVNAVGTAYYANPIVIVDTIDPNTDPAADGVAESEAALTIYIKKAVEIESDRDILAKTTVFSADQHYVAVLSNDSKVVLAKFNK